MLPDVLDYNLKIVFCGTAAGQKSARLKLYYAGPGNKFWPVLHETGLTPIRLYPEDFRKVIQYGIGLTDLVKNKAGMDSILDRSDFGSNNLVQVIKKYSPKYVAFNGKKAGKEFFNHDVNYGLQQEFLYQTKFYVLPSTSSAANAFWDIEYWKDLARKVK